MKASRFFTTSSILLSILGICVSFSTNSLSSRGNCQTARKLHPNNGGEEHKSHLTETTTANTLTDEKMGMDNASMSRRSMMQAFGAFALGVELLMPMEAEAKTDCMSDCLKNCKLIAPKDTAYCLDNCKSYCAQDDRTDGLSGSVSSNGGEMGILGTSTVVKGEDKPPSISLPGLDFTSEKGKKLIGY